MFNPLALFATFKTAIIVGAIAIVVGFGSGWATKAKFMDAAEVNELRADMRQTAVNVVEAGKQSASIESKVVVANKTSTSIQAAVQKRLTDQKDRTNETQSTAEASAFQCPAFVLDVGTVRLLNAARQGATVDSAGGSAEALDAPSGIAISKLIDNDLEVVKLYKELAIRHDELVDIVEKKLKEQAAK